MAKQGTLIIILLNEEGSGTCMLKGSYLAIRCDVDKPLQSHLKINAVVTCVGESTQMYDRWIAPPA
jgi:hypothetical protein